MQTRPGSAYQEEKEEGTVIILLAIAVFFSAAILDYCNTKYVLNVAEGNAVKAGLWSVFQWLSSLVGFLIVVKVTLWLLPVEAIGLFVGTWFSMRAKVKS